MSAWAMPRGTGTDQDRDDRQDAVQDIVDRAVVLRIGIQTSARMPSTAQAKRETRINGGAAPAVIAGFSHIRTASIGEPARASGAVSPVCAPDAHARRGFGAPVSLPW
ncbi:hypothetical protein [Nocardia sp. NPDC049707]|uniref:hypothetical protein n=1 Tax=Nocardia sp. NPDC049707 TaxID=3154735 RepID=UPI003434127A